MRLHPLRIIAVAALFPLLLSCATSTDFSKLPAREIDRDWNLPGGVTRFQAIFGAAIDAEVNPFFYPAYWEQAVSDTVTIVWMPLPFEARFRLVSTKEFTYSLGASFLGQIFSRNRNFDWRPAIQGLGRYRFSRHWALDFETLGSLEITRDGYGNPGLLGMVRAGPRWQPADPVSLGVSLAWQIENGTVRSRYVGVLPPGNTGIESERTRMTLPLSLDATWNPHPQWELRLNAWFYRFGYSPGYTSVPFYLSFAHLW